MPLIIRSILASLRKSSGIGVLSFTIPNRHEERQKDAVRLALPSSSSTRNRVKLRDVISLSLRSFSHSFIFPYLRRYDEVFRGRYPIGLGPAACMVLLNNKVQKL